MSAIQIMTATIIKFLVSLLVEKVYHSNRLYFQELNGYSSLLISQRKVCGTNNVLLIRQRKVCGTHDVLVHWVDDGLDALWGRNIPLQSVNNKISYSKASIQNPKTKNSDSTENRTLAIRCSVFKWPNHPKSGRNVWVFDAIQNPNNLTAEQLHIDNSSD